MKSPIGDILIASKNKDSISLVSLNNNSLIENYYLKKGYSLKYADSHQYLSRAITEINAYFKGTLKTFTIKADPINGTIFQKAVWKELNNIPYGQTRSYSDIARSIGHYRAYRAVGQALNKNPIPIIMPCHRVVGKHGNLTGFASGLNNKKWLINHEKSYC